MGETHAFSNLFSLVFSSVSAFQTPFSIHPPNTPPHAAQAQQKGLGLAFAWTPRKCSWISSSGFSGLALAELRFKAIYCEANSECSWEERTRGGKEKRPLIPRRALRCLSCLPKPDCSSRVYSKYPCVLAVENALIIACWTKLGQGGEHTASGFIPKPLIHHDIFSP